MQASQNASAERTESLWLKDARERKRWPIPAPPLATDQRCDAVVIGGGIAGLSVAVELAEAGKSVVLVDRGPLGGGMTGRTTAHLAPPCDDLLSELIGLRGKELARLHHRSHAAGLDRIEEIVHAHGIECGFRRLDGFMFPAIGTPEKEAAAFDLPAEALPDALYWDMEDPYHYVRLQPATEGGG